MTDRIHSLTVILDRNYREDDVVMLADAIRQLHGVLSVATNVANLDSYMAEERAKAAIRERLSSKIVDHLQEKR